MALYFAFPFGFYALALVCSKSAKQYPKSMFGRIFYVVFRVAILGAVFVLTNLAMWYPWIHESGIGGIEQIFTRIFPIRRGIFEDKVASFWCVLHNFYKVNTIFDRPT